MSNNLDRVTEAARSITNLGLPDNCVYSKCSPFEQSVIQEFIQACFDARRELQEVASGMFYTEEDLRDEYNKGWDDGDDNGYDRGYDEGYEVGKFETLEGDR